MTAVKQGLAALVGLFIEDGSLALGVLGLVGGIALLRFGLAFEPLAAGALLFAGAPALLIENVMRSNRGR